MHLDFLHSKYWITVLETKSFFSTLCTSRNVVYILINGARATKASPILVNGKNILWLLAFPLNYTVCLPSCLPAWLPGISFLADSDWKPFMSQSQTLQYYTAMTNHPQKSKKERTVSFGKQILLSLHKWSHHISNYILGTIAKLLHPAC